MSKNILVVDDAPVSLKFIGYFLRKEGYEVTEASDGVEAIELIDNSRFDLVLPTDQTPAHCRSSLRLSLRTITGTSCEGAML